VRLKLAILIFVASCLLSGVHSKCCTQAVSTVSNSDWSSSAALNRHHRHHHREIGFAAAQRRHMLHQHWYFQQQQQQRGWSSVRSTRDVNADRRFDTVHADDAGFRSALCRHLRVCHPSPREGLGLCVYLRPKPKIATNSQHFIIVSSRVSQAQAEF